MDYFEEFSEVGEYLTREYNVEKENQETASWELLLEGEANSYSVIAHWKEKSLLLTVDSFGPSPRDEVCGYRLNRYLLEANDEMKWGFFSLDRDGSSELNINLPLSGLNENVIKRAFDHLLYYGDKHYFNVLNLANNSHAKIVYEEEEF
jgi:hypothetical protein